MADVELDDRTDSTAGFLGNNSKTRCCSFSKFCSIPVFFVILVLATVGGFLAIFLTSQHPESPSKTRQIEDLWRDRSIYFLLTDRFACDPNHDCDVMCADLRAYCGGTYDGVTRHLDYIQDMGFDAIWISPIPENSADPFAGPGYHGYYASNLYELNPHFGDEASLHKMIDECHKRDILVMLDVVANHMGPFSYEYPPESYFPFDNVGAWYHTACPATDQQKVNTYPGDYNHPGYSQDLMERCWLYTLPDLKTELPAVQQILNDWVEQTVKEYAFDAIRLDTVPYVSHQFWRDYTTASGVFSIGEISSFNNSFVASYQTTGAMTSTLSYPAYFTFKSVWMESPRGPMTSLSSTFKEVEELFTNMYLLGVFVDNHDTPRALDIMDGDIALLQNSLAYIFFLPGIPILYYGTEQGLEGRTENYTDTWGSCTSKDGGDPCNREDLWSTNYNQQSTLYKFVASLNNFRKSARSSKYYYVELLSQPTIYAYARGPALVVVTNLGNATSTLSATIDLTAAENSEAAEELLKWHEDPPAPVSWRGKRLVNVLNSSDVVVVGEDSKVAVTLYNGLPKVYTAQQGGASSKNFFSKMISALKF